MCARKASALKITFLVCRTGSRDRRSVVKRRIMISLVVHAFSSRQMWTPAGKAAMASTISACVRSLLFATKTWGKSGCTSASSHTKAARDIIALVSPFGAGLVRDRGVPRRRFAFSVKWPCRASWKYRTAVSSKLTRRGLRPGATWACKKLLQVHTAVACGRIFQQNRGPKRCRFLDPVLLVG